MTPFTPAQITSIKTAIAADPTMQAAAAGGTDAGYALIRDTFNAVAVELGWQTACPIEFVFNAVDFSKYTPTDVPTGTDLPAVSATFLNRSQAIIIKQANLLAFLKRDTLNFARPLIRSGLRDSVIALPSGAAGAAASAAGASGANVLTVGTRAINKLEKLLSTGSQTTGTVTAEILSFEGSMTTQIVSDVLAS